MTPSTLYVRQWGGEAHTAREAFEGSCVSTFRLAISIRNPDDAQSIKAWMTETQDLANCLLAVFDQLTLDQQHRAVIQLGWRAIPQPIPSKES